MSEEPPPTALVVPRLLHPPVLLRAFTPADVGAVREAAADPYVVATTTVPDDPDDAALLAFVARQHERSRRGSGWSLAVADEVTDRCVGQVGLWPAGDGRATVGYWTVPSARGRGYATAALRAVTGWAVLVPGVDRLELAVEPWNAASLAVGAAAGFRRTALVPGYLEVDGVRRDMVVLERAPG